MSNWNHHQIWNDCRNFNGLTPKRRQEVVEIFKTKEMAQDYSYVSNLVNMLPSLVKQEVLDIFDNFAINYNFRHCYYQDHANKFTMAAYAIDPVKVKTAVLSKTQEDFDKILLAFANLTTDEEVRGLRAVSQSKRLPHAIYENKYSPTKAALDELPPVMRLKVFETLTSSSHLAYNIFINFPDPDEFKVMMFSSVLRHRERAEAVWQKYQEIVHLGENASVEIRTNCDNCGEVRLTLKSNRVRTKAGLENVGLWNIYRDGNCPLCSRKLQMGAQILTE